MTNKEYLSSCNVYEFEFVIHEIYFGNIIGRKGSTPNMVEIIKWLNKDYTSCKKFWDNVKNQDYEWVKEELENS